MLCEIIENRILDYQENQLSAAQRAEVETHLAGCPACREFARQLQQLDAALAARVKIPALSAGFDRQLRERIQAAPAALSGNAPVMVANGMVGAARCATPDVSGQRGVPTSRDRRITLSEAQRAERKRQLETEFEAGMARIGRGSFALGSLLNYLAWPALAAVAGWLAWLLTAQWTAHLPAQSLGGLAPGTIPWLVASAVFLAVGLAQAFPRPWRFFRV
jgi:anti-sigma factor RsiW